MQNPTGYLGLVGIILIVGSISYIFYLREKRSLLEKRLQAWQDAVGYEHEQKIKLIANDIMRLITKFCFERLREKGYLFPEALESIQRHRSFSLLGSDFEFPQEYVCIISNFKVITQNEESFQAVAEEIDKTNKLIENILNNKDLRYKLVTSDPREWFFKSNGVESTMLREYQNSLEKFK